MRKEEAKFETRFISNLGTQEKITIISDMFSWITMLYGQWRTALMRRKVQTLLPE